VRTAWPLPAVKAERHRRARRRLVGAAVLGFLALIIRCELDAPLTKVR